MKDYQYGELTKEILKGLAVGGFIVAMVAMPGLAYIMPLFKPRGAKDKYRINQNKLLQHTKRIKVHAVISELEMQMRTRSSTSHTNPA